MLAASEIIVFAILERDSISTSHTKQFQVLFGITGQLI